MSRFLSPRFAGLEVYTPGEQPTDQQYVKLNTNESPYPPSPGVFDRLSRLEVGRLNLYPDPTGRRLKQALAGLYGVGEENVFLSNGSDETLNFAFMAFCDGERKVAFPAVSYGFYPVYARLYGLDALEIPLKPDFSIDPADYCGLNRNIVIANPNAPTGLALSVPQVEKIVRSNPNHVVLIDEAYVDFGADSCLNLIGRYDNLLVVRTYSKSRCMAGARLGFALAQPELIADLERIKFSTNPYNINRLTLAAGEAAVEDEDYYQARCRDIIVTRQMAARQLEELGFQLTDSRANFLFARHPGADGGALYRGLKEKGVLVRHFDKPGISDYLRITVGTPEQMDRLTAALRELLARHPA